MFQISITPEEIDKLELAAFDGEICVIDRQGPEYDAAVRFLSRQKMLGFDTESRPSFSPGQPHYGVSLLQLSGPGKAFLFRVKSCGIDDRLAAILSNKSILKIGAAVNDDVRGLQRYKGFQPGGFVDLQKIVWEYGIRDKSVKKMAAIIMSVRISKTQQLSNWEASELSEPQRKYAATDAWVCREMYKKLRRCAKAPLTFEQMHPELAEKQEKVLTPEQLEARAEKRREKRRRHRRNLKKRSARRRSRTKNKSNVKDNSEKR